MERLGHNMEISLARCMAGIKDDYHEHNDHIRHHPRLMGSTADSPGKNQRMQVDCP